MDIKKNTSILKRVAIKHGFDYCAVAKAGFLEDEAPKLEKWLNQGMHGKMNYMANHFDMRLDPTLLVPGAKSVVSLIYNYFPSKSIPTEGNYKLAKYAYGTDYHFVIKDKLKLMLEDLKSEIGDIEGRVFVDSAPVMERQWAQKSGLGWLGKNALLLNKQMGSFFFLAEIISDLELEPDGAVKNHCGTCTKCMDACPTDAIAKAGVVDGSKCISYLTIELKEEIPSSMKGKFEDWMFGCDICQDVCPWNRFSKPNTEELFNPDEDLRQMKKSDWIELTDDVFRKVFKKSAVKRTKLNGLRRNISFLNSSSE